MYPVLLQTGSFTVYTFSVTLVLAFLLGGRVVTRELARRRMDQRVAGEILLAAALGGLAGARGWWIVEERGLASLIGPWSGGLVWYGGLAGGAVLVTVVLEARRLPWLTTADCIAPALALGLAIGRLGCHLAGDGDWGTVTSLPWGVAYQRGVAGWPHPPGVRVHPAPLYECAANGTIFAMLCAVGGARARDGTVFASYCVLAGVCRFAVESIRVNRTVVWGLTEAQLVSVALAALGAVTLWASSVREG